MDASPRAKAGAESERRSPLSTGFKLFLILSLALLPLALIALLATLQSTRTADQQRQAEMRVALTESVRQLGSAFASDTALMRNAMSMIDAPGQCERLTTVFASAGSAMPRFALFGPGSIPVCAAPGFVPSRPGTIGLGERGAPRVELDETGVRLFVISESGGQAARIDYPPRVLEAIGAPGGFALPYTLTLMDGAASLEIVDRRAIEASIAGYYAVAEDLGRDDLVVELRAARDAYTAPELIALLLPIVMWASAAAISWLVVDRVLIRPLRRLEAQVSSFQPGQVIAPHGAGPAASEIDQLGESFSALSRTVAAHEAELAAGLTRQTKLTREVHHRVKNNLQVVASLISLHARGQKSDEVIRAYSSIQRRVDALAVVLRHHYAELEVSRGVSLRALIGELAQNFRGTQPEGDLTPSITLDLCPCYSHQDIAVPIAFLLTELIELSTIRAPGMPITIELTEADETLARLSVRSAGLERDDVPERFSRVLEGLSRQLRAALDKDFASGAMSILVPVEIDGDRRAPG